MKYIISSLLLLAGSLAPTDAALTAEPRNPPPPLCGPTTPGTCEVNEYPSIVKSASCGFESKCGGLGLFVEYPSMECYYNFGLVTCDAWPKTWADSPAQITYLWSVSGALSLSDPGEHSPEIQASCNSQSGGTVYVSMQAPYGGNWVTMSVSLPCRNQIEY